MTVILINPNSTEAMTRSALMAARRAAPEVTFEGWTSAKGPPAIQGPEDGARAVPPLLDLVKTASDQGAEAIIIACFDDTGLEEAQALARCPVLGIGQASFIIARMLPGFAAVITTVPEAVPVIEANIGAHGHRDSIPVVLAADVPVLMLEDDPERAAEAFMLKAENLPAHIKTVILGCAGAVNIRAALQERLDQRILDGATCAAHLSRALRV